MVDSVIKSSSEKSALEFWWIHCIEKATARRLDLIYQFPMTTTQPFQTIDTPKQDYAVAVPTDDKDHLRNVHKMSVEWKIDELTVEVKKSRRQVETKTILKNVHGVASAGELVVIMGPSGGGKSSLLDIVAGRNKAFKGHVKVNGEPWNDTINKHTCYVLQDDVFYHTLTVEEHLQFQAQFRMGKASTPQQRNERVQYLIDELGLRNCKDTRIGNSVVRGISGGERKRLSFATELLTNPSLLFVDEPTSGLDSFMAESVVQQMQKLAREGRTILATIHQPSSQLFSLFDSLYLLSNGRTVYYGKAADSMAYFTSIGYPCPNYMNPTDYFMRQIVQMDDEASKRVDEMVAQWEDKELLVLRPAPEYASIHELSVHNESRLSWFGQLRVLCKRNLTRLVRDRVAFKARFFQSIFISLIVDLIYLQLKMDQTGVQSFSGALFFIIINQVSTSSTSELVQIPLELAIISRENNGGLYSTATWYLAKNVSEFPMQIFFPMIFLIPLYFMVGFGASHVSLFFTFYLFLMFVNSTATGLGYMISCSVRRPDLAPVVGMAIILPCIVFGGLLINADDTPDYFVWLEYLSLLNASSASCVHNGEQVLANSSLDVASMAVDLCALLAINVGFRLIGLFFLLKNIKKRD
ncbi:hypothetical protein AC1031_005675 [Aphanomyces cochlioides]|nr:hypothetical protein AC1031_005675 [Aphanomyces cochlioides]